MIQSNIYRKDLFILVLAHADPSTTLTCVPPSIVPTGMYIDAVQQMGSANEIPTLHLWKQLIE